MCHDTTVEAGNLISKVFHRLGKDEQERIERAILSLPSASADQGVVESAKRTRNRLFGCIPHELVSTNEGRALSAEINQQGGPPPNRPLFSTSFRAVSLTAGELLDIPAKVAEAEPNKRIREIAAPVETFIGRSSNAVPSLDELDEIMPQLRRLRRAIDESEPQGVDRKQRDACYGTLIQACATACKAKNLDRRTKELQFLAEQLLQASNDEAPHFNKEVEERFDTNPSWGSPTPRIEAAAGLMCLCGYEELAGSEVLSAIENLARDPVAAVRFQIAQRLGCLAKSAPKRMWQLIGQFAARESSTVILDALALSTLRALRRHDPNSVIEWTLRIHSRAMQMENADELRSSCSLICLEFHLFGNQPRCDEFIARILADPSKYSVEAGHLPCQLRESFTAGPTTGTTQAQDRARSRAFGIAIGLASFVSSRITALRKDDDTDREAIESLFHLADNLANELYFASDVFSRKHPNLEEPELPSQHQARFGNRFLVEALPTIRELSKIGHAHISYRLLETLIGLVEHDPANVIIETRDVILHAQRGLSLESLAQVHVVEFAERFLAEYRDVLSDNVECREALLDLLDGFVEAGWTRATTLTYGLHEMYR